jgi:hypothetical protein
MGISSNQAHTFTNPMHTLSTHIDFLVYPHAFISREFKWGLSVNKWSDVE